MATATINAVDILTKNGSFVKASDGSTAITLDKVAGTTLLQNLMQKSLFSKITNNGLSLTVDSKGITYTIVPNAIFKNRGTGLGYGQVGKTTLGKTDTAKWNESIVAIEGLTAQEAQLMDSTLLAKKLAKQFEKMSRIHERSAFNALENKIIGDNKATKNFNYTAKTPQEVKRQITQLANQLLATYDENQGIDLLDREQIVIFLKPDLFDYIADLGLIGDRAALTMEEGSYSFGKIAGYTVYSNPFLAKMDAIITTNFIALDAINLINAGVKNADTVSADKVVVTEFADTFKIVYDNLALGLTSLSVPAKANEDKLISKPSEMTA